jgi:hypothetical protein
MGWLKDTEEVIASFPLLAIAFMTALATAVSIACSSTRLNPHWSMFSALEVILSCVSVLLSARGERSMEESRWDAGEVVVVSLLIE